MPPLNRLRKSFVSGIKSERTLISFLRRYYADRFDITLEHHHSNIPPLVQYFNWGMLRPKEFNKVIPITLYSIKFWMGTNEQGYPVALQLQVIMRVLVIDEEETGKYYSLFVELISNSEHSCILFCDFLSLYTSDYARRTHINGYRSYAKDPLVFLKTIQASNEERKALRKMMRIDGVSFSSSSSSSCNKINRAAEKKLLSMQRYFNRHYYFRYIMFENIHWKLTRELKTFKAWRHNNSNNLYVRQKRIEHECYCYWQDINCYPHRLLMKPTLKVLFEKFLDDYFFLGWNNTHRVFSDWDECHEKLCRFTLKYIDRVYHLNTVNGPYCEPCVRPCVVNSYHEFIARTKVKNYGSFYLELIIITYSNCKSECILFLTQNFQLFMDIIQTGKKDEIYNFIIRDEGLLSPGSLQAKCIQAFTNNVLDTEETECRWTAAALWEEMNSTLRIPDSFKYRFIDEVKWTLMITSWKKAVEDLAKEAAADLIF